MVAPAPSKTRPHTANAYRTCIVLQELLIQDAKNPKTSANSRARVCTAFDLLEERKRILRMRPKPKDVDVLELAKAKAAQRQLRAANAIDVTEAPAARENTPEHRVQPAQEPDTGAR